MSETISRVAKQAISGIRESLDAGKEAEALVGDVVRFADAEAVARARFRKKAQAFQPDQTTFSAVAEWRQVKEIRDLEDELRIEIVSKHGQKAWDEVMEIKAKHQKFQSENKTAYGHDVRALRLLMLACFCASAIVTTILYKNGLI